MASSSAAVAAGRVVSSSTCASPPPTSTFVTSTTSNDVLLGRGAPTIHFEGNVRFRHLIATRKVEYMSTGRHKRKCVIAQQIIDEIVVGRRGRFLRKINTVEEAERLGVPPGVKQAWVPADPTVILEKVKQALRDKDPVSSDYSHNNNNNGTAISQPPTTQPLLVGSSSSLDHPDLSFLFAQHRKSLVETQYLEKLRLERQFQWSMFSDPPPSTGTEFQQWYNQSLQERRHQQIQQQASATSNSSNSLLGAALADPSSSLLSSLQTKDLLLASVLAQQQQLQQLLQSASSSDFSPTELSARNTLSFSQQQQQQRPPFSAAVAYVAPTIATTTTIGPPPSNVGVTPPSRVQPTLSSSSAMMALSGIAASNSENQTTSPKHASNCMGTEDTVARVQHSSHKKPKI